MAIQWSLTHYNTYLEGHKYTIITDHAALRYLFNNKDKTPRMHRMVAKLSPYELQIEYRPGKENFGADLLSREDELMESTTTKEWLRQASNNYTVDMNSDEEKIIEANPMETRSRSTTKDATARDATPAGPTTTAAAPRKIVPREKRRRRIARQSKGADYELEKIISRRPSSKYEGEYEYRVRWKGCEAEEDTWEPLVNLQGSMRTVAEFEQQRQSAEIRKTGVEAEQYGCEECGEGCHTWIELQVHRYHAHGVRVQIDGARLISVADPELVKTLQQREGDFKHIYDSDCGVKAIEMSKKQMQVMRQYEFGSAMMVCCTASTCRHCEEEIGRSCRYACAYLQACAQTYCARHMLACCQVILALYACMISCAAACGGRV